MAYSDVRTPHVYVLVLRVLEFLLCRLLFVLELAQGVGSMSQVLEGLLGGRERHPPGGATWVALGACRTTFPNRDVGRARALLRTAVLVWCKAQVGDPVCLPLS